MCRTMLLSVVIGARENYGPGIDQPVSMIEGAKRNHAVIIIIFCVPHVILGL